MLTSKLKHKEGGNNMVFHTIRKRISEVRVSGLIGIVRAVLLRMNRNRRTFLMKGEEVWKSEAL